MVQAFEELRIQRAVQSSKQDNIICKADGGKVGKNSSLPKNTEKSLEKKMAF